MNTLIRRLLWCLAAAALSVLGTGCEEAGGSAALPDPGIQRWDNAATVTIQGTKKTLTARAELAITPQERAKGLMFVKEPLGDGVGMLFIMDADDDHGFWMKNTFIPLDMVYITYDRKVAGIVENATPHSRTSRKCGVASRYILELDAGSCATYGIQAGQPVEMSLP